MNARTEARGFRDLEALAVGALAAALLGYELALMRILLVASWYHFAFLVITIALLGFGLSGSVLTRAREALSRRNALRWLLLATALAMPICTRAALHLEVEARLVPALFAPQVSRWIAFWALATVPFLVGATALGLALSPGGPRAARLYAANLLGSGIGALAAPFAMMAVAPAWLPTLTGLIALLAAAAAGAGGRWIALALVVGGASTAIDAPRVRMDPFKTGAHIERLARQGAAERLGHRQGLRGGVELWRSSSFHDLPFLSGDSPAPPLHLLTIDGNAAGAVLAGDPAAVENTLMSVAYEFTAPRPRVLLLGERGGANLWLASRKNAARADAVQPDPEVRAIVEQHGGGVLAQRGVLSHLADPRRFIDRSVYEWDLIQLVSLEGSAAGTGGMGGLGQDALVTVEGIGRALERLAPNGVLSVCRALQTPPRDDVKLLALFAAALRRSGRDPGAHIVVVRDFLAACTLVKKSPWSDLARVREVIAKRELTPVWFSGVSEGELNRPDALPDGDWLNRAAARLFASDAEAARVVDEWPYDVRPPTDDRPFFLDFFRWRSFGALRHAYGNLWLTRVELAFPFVLAALVLASLTGALGLLLPLLFNRNARGGRGVACAYFGALGLGYLVTELAVLSRVTLAVGDPVIAASLTIAVFLVCSGAGGFAATSLAPKASEHRGQRPAHERPPLVWTALAIAALLLVEIQILPRVGMIAAVALLAPLAFAMGMPMVLGLARLDETLVPWAWGANGFTSVIGAPLATAIGMTWGFSVAAALAAACYLAAALLFQRLQPSL